MKRPVEVCVEGLGHPEGPDVLPDGRVVFVNTYGSEILVYEPGKGSSRYAYTGGGPNAAMLGSDGYVYNTQCPTVGAWVAPDSRPPSIQRAAPDGAVEIVATEADGIPLTAPNDLSFGPDGRLYFTDSGDWDPVGKPHRGFICVIDTDGSCHVLEELEPTYPNGIVCEPDGSVVWVESYTLKVIRRRPDGTKEVLHTLAEGHVPDGFKLDTEGNFWITAFGAGGLDVLSSTGEHLDFLETGGVPLNCSFDGSSIYITDFGTTDTGAGIAMNGRLIRVDDVGATGMQLFRGAIS